MLFTSGCADSWLLYPSTQPVDPNGAQQRFVESHGHEVEVYIARSPGVVDQPLAYSLEFCGNSARAENVASQSAQVWGSKSVEVWAVNYPGFGKSDGPTKLNLIPPEALDTFDQLRKIAAGRPIFVRGFSMGTTAALYVAANRPVSGIMLQSPPPLQDEIMEDWGWWNLWMVASITALEVPGELNSLSNAPKVKVPGVFIITGKDTIVPPEFQFKVFNAYAGDKLDVLRPDDNHNDPISPADGDRVQRALDWLWRSKFNQTHATPLATPMQHS